MAKGARKHSFYSLPIPSCPLASALGLRLSDNLALSSLLVRQRWVKEGGRTGPSDLVPPILYAPFNTTLSQDPETLRSHYKEM